MLLLHHDSVYWVINHLQVQRHVIQPRQPLDTMDRPTMSIPDLPGITISVEVAACNLDTGPLPSRPLRFR